ncbi:hypothetical protein EG68_02193 [Paragonimus skrjabini miyazakii]|uniref:Uncharacterized protein n=1 Tax=Paragonimus skrjabini miyazakii TaxID=59628 RepID=A0A8S9Z5K7_9TREM|nr:hypothetical protein EG68_02193 [Paragonimus skrjabini miyazakii]
MEGSLINDRLMELLAVRRSAREEIVQLRRQFLSERTYSVPVPTKELTELPNLGPLEMPLCPLKNLKITESELNFFKENYEAYETWMRYKANHS